MTNKSTELIIRGGASPDLIFSASFPFSLYQCIMTAARKPAKSPLKLGFDEWQSAARRAYPVVHNLGPMNYFEMSVSTATDIDEFQHRLDARARDFAAGWVAALEQVSDLYRRTLWPEHRADLQVALATIRELLEPNIESLLRLQAEGLGFAFRENAYHVALVPLTYAEAGGYSHPTVIDVSRFRGLGLVEAILHELTHVWADENRDNAQSAVSLLLQMSSERGLPRDQALRLLHALIFHSSAELVREVIDGQYVAFGEQAGVYRRHEARIGNEFSFARLAEIWTQRVNGSIALKPALTALIELAGGSTDHGSR